METYRQKKHEKCCADSLTFKKIKIAGKLIRCLDVNIDVHINDVDKSYVVLEVKP